MSKRGQLAGAQIVVPALLWSACAVAAQADCETVRFSYESYAQSCRAGNAQSCSNKEMVRQRFASCFTEERASANVSAPAPVPSRVRSDPDECSDDQGLQIEVPYSIAPIAALGGRADVAARVSPAGGTVSWRTRNPKIVSFSNGSGNGGTRQTATGRRVTLVGQQCGVATVEATVSLQCSLGDKRTTTSAQVSVVPDERRMLASYQKLDRLKAQIEGVKKRLPGELLAFAEATKEFWDAVKDAAENVTEWGTTCMPPAKFARQWAKCTKLTKEAVDAVAEAIDKGQHAREKAKALEASAAEIIRYAEQMQAILDGIESCNVPKANEYAAFVKAEFTEAKRIERETKQERKKIERELERLKDVRDQLKQVEGDADKCRQNPKACPDDSPTLTKP